MSRSCEFGSVADDMLRDCFVVEILDSATQRSLLTESDLTFQKAVNIATAREIADKDVKEMGGNGDINVVLTRSHPSKVTNANKSNETAASKSGSPQPCLGCGQLHWRSDCSYKNAEGFECKAKGHIRAMCQKKRKRTGKRINKKMRSSRMQLVNHQRIVEKIWRAMAVFFSITQLCTKLHVIPC